MVHRASHTINSLMYFFQALSKSLAFKSSTGCRMGIRHDAIYCNLLVINNTPLRPTAIGHYKDYSQIISLQLKLHWPTYITRFIDGHLSSAVIMLRMRWPHWQPDRDFQANAQRVRIPYILTPTKKYLLCKRSSSYNSVCCVNVL